MKSTLARITTAGALTAALLTTATGLADADSLQPTIPGCELQGGCITDSSGTTTAAPSAPTPTFTGAAAMSWARQHLGSTAYDGLCQGFVHDAYAQVGLDIGNAASAIAFWNAHPEQQHPGDTAPPAGALVYWGPTAYNPYGHVGISEGGDDVISTQERTTRGVHEFPLADRNSTGAYPYLGWIQY